MSSLYEFEATGIDGKRRRLSEFEGKVVLVVNVASKCGLTPQYDGLERLYEEYRGRGFEILAFPCNQFAGQEPGDEAEIEEFCRLQYGVRFPLFGKIEVNGSGRHPLFAWLCEEDSTPEGRGDVQWNFGKFLIGRDGRMRSRFGPPVEPCAAEVKAAIEKALEA